MAWGVAAADAFEIDRLNILQASRLAMRRAIDRLNAQLHAAHRSACPVTLAAGTTAAAAVPARQTGCDYLLVDAVTVDAPIAQRALIHGDSLSFSIAAASILAKTERDAALVEWDHVFPEYGLAHNKGYSTPDHLAALQRLGPTTLHRFSFEPVRNFNRYESWMGYPIPQQGELFACR